MPNSSYTCTTVENFAQCSSVHDSRTWFHKDKQPLHRAPYVEFTSHFHLAALVAVLRAEELKQTPLILENKSGYTSGTTLPVGIPFEATSVWKPREMLTVRIFSCFVAQYGEPRAKELFVETPLEVLREY